MSTGLRKSAQMILNLSTPCNHKKRLLETKNTYSTQNTEGYDEIYSNVQNYSSKLKGL